MTNSQAVPWIAPWNSNGTRAVQRLERRDWRNKVTLGQWLGLAAIASALYILWQIRQIVLLMFTAVVLATAANVMVRRLKKFGLKRSQAMPLAVVLLLLFAILFVGLVVPPFIEQFRELILRIPQGLQQLQRLVPNVIDYILGFVPPGADGITDMLEQVKAWSLNEVIETPGTTLEWDFTWLPDQAGALFKNFFDFFNNALGVALQVLLVLILTLMLLANPKAYRQALLVLFPSFYRRRADEILNKCEIALTNWFSGILISSTAIAITSGIGLSLLGIDLALAHALLAGLLNFIPNLGPALSVVFPISVAVLDPQPGFKVVGVIVLYILLQNLESYLLTPTVMARQVSLLPALTLVAQLFFASLFGALGLLLALPLTVVSMTWIQELLIKDILDVCQPPPWVERFRTVRQEAERLASKRDLQVQTEAVLAPQGSLTVVTQLPGDGDLSEALADAPAVESSGDASES